MAYPHVFSNEAGQARWRARELVPAAAKTEHMGLELGLTHI